MRPAARVAATAFGAAVALTGLVALWTAYLYEPNEVRDRPSAYLAADTTDYVDTTVARFHYQRLGSGPPVLLIHGGGEWLYSYRDTIRTLAAAGYSVFALDLPGHGYTEVRQKDFAYNLLAMTSAVASFMDAVNVRRAALIGHSWGGGIALSFAQRFPDRVSRLVLIDSSGLDVPDVPQWRLLGVPVIGEIMSKLVRRSDVADGLRMSFHHDALVTDAMIDEVWVPLTFRDNRRAQYLLERNLDWSLTQESLSTTLVPTLVLWGADDQYLSSGNARVFTDFMPHATAAVLPECGHSAHEDCPDAVDSHLVAFLAPLRT